MTFGHVPYVRAKKEISYLNMVGFNNLEIPPQKHLCFADYDFHKSKRFSRYKVSGYEIGLPNPYFKTRIFPVGSSFFLESQFFV